MSLPTALLKQTALIVLACCIRSLPSGAQDTTALRDQNRAIVASATGSEGIFTVNDDGSIRHVQSGLLCPAKYPNVQFFEVLIYPSEAGKGLDVGCDYIRKDDKGGADAKLTIFATKAAGAETVDVAFADDRNGLLKVWPSAKSLGAAIEIDDKPKADSLFHDLRSEEFLISLNDRTYTTQLYVTIRQGWIIEIRTTFSGLPNVIEVTKEGGVTAGVSAGGDRLMGPKAYLDAITSLGS